MARDPLGAAPDGSPRQPRNGETITIPAADPLNLTGIVLPGPRIPAIGAGTVTYTDGAVPAASTEPISEPA